MAQSEVTENDIKLQHNQRSYRNTRGNGYSNRYQRNRNFGGKSYPNSNVVATNSTAFSNPPENFSQEVNYQTMFTSNLDGATAANVPPFGETLDKIDKNAFTHQTNNNYLSTSKYTHNEPFRTSSNQYPDAPNNTGYKKKYRNSQNSHNSRSKQIASNSSSHFSHDTESPDTKFKTKHRPVKDRSTSSRDRDNSEEYHKNGAQSLNPQRGKIIGGRYIRKNNSNPAPHAHSYNSPLDDVNSKENFNSQHRPNLRNRDWNQQPREQQRKTYYDLDYKRDYAYENETGFNSNSKRKFQSNTRKGDSVSSPTDVYHYYSTPDIGKKTNPSIAAFHKENHSSKISSYKEDDANQRELLIHRLSKGECECLVCCEQIRVKGQIWHCVSCYHVFHLHCIRKWARSPAAVVEDGGWRCPACQSLTSKVPYDYFCFCGKQKNPDVNYHITPHSCGEICSRKRADCSHLCKELCHPGPCPPCLVVVQKSCACGKTFKTTTCKQSSEETCSSTCDKLLNCGVHSCKSLCHSGDCLPCEAEVAQECYCGKDDRIIPCTRESSAAKNFSCSKICEKLLNCGIHKCSLVCHPGSCKLCDLSVEVINTCPCGKSSIKELVTAGQASFRKSCEDPIPVCNEICDKILFCGPKDNPHRCQSSCHTGNCPPCSLSTSMKCRCGAFTKEFNCKEISSTFVYTCEKRCNRRKDCGRHKCLNKCCVNFEHKCELICNKKLSCGNHQCQETCHAGNCPTCWNVSFDELRCHCGESVSYPPIHCGTKPPECSKPCIRTHPCDHEVKHTCHSDDSCPPCTSLTVKWCYGHHKQCGSVMCFLDGVSCGMSCRKPLSCEKHECQLTCHPGPCVKPGEKCTQLCVTPRSCGHPCSNVCHDGTCPETPCKTQVTLNCPCGHRSENTTCYDSTKSYRLISVSVLATKMQEIKDGQSVNLNDVLGRKSKNNKLQCNEECAVIERNRRLAVALQIQNPDLSCSPGPPSYSEFLKTEAKKNLTFVSDVYNKITELVQLAKESKQKCRSHSFPAMNRDHRRVVHELAEFFGCETQSYDEEPKKNVVVTAHKTKCWLPFISIMTVVQRDMGFRKGPTPVLIQRDSKNSSGANTANIQKKKIDYFDYKE